MKTYLIHLMRHGLTQANIDGKYVGVTDVPLSQKGLKQLDSFKSKYDYKNPQLIFSSPLTRCRQTVERIFGNTDMIIVEGLKECNMGIFEGKTNEELKGNKLFEDWLKSSATPPRGESNQDFAHRVCNAFNDTIREILKTGKTESLICTHGGVIMTLLGTYAIPKRNLIEWMANNGRGFTIRVTPGIWMRTGMVEVVSEYPAGSADEPDLSINPVKQLNQQQEVDYFLADIED